MSGDCFEQVWSRVEYECLDRLKEYMNDGLINWDFSNIDDYKFMLHNLFEGFYKIAEGNIWMKRLDWYLGDDDGEVAFQKRLNKELDTLFQNKEKDRRCFDCFRMSTGGCTLLTNRGKTITLTDSICKYFIPMDWKDYKVKEYYCPNRDSLRIT